jgi:hypothetical protein
MAQDVINRSDMIKIIGSSFMFVCDEFLFLSFMEVEKIGITERYKNKRGIESSK